MILLICQNTILRINYMNITYENFTTYKEISQPEEEKTQVIVAITKNCLSSIRTIYGIA